MNTIIWTDDNGYKHLSTMMNGESNPENGIQANPPDVNMIDWHALNLPSMLESFKQDLHNGLVDRGLFTWTDVQLKGGLLSVLSNTVKKHKVDVTLSKLKKQLIVLYKLDEKVMED